MIRVIIAGIILRSTGAVCRYEVRRVYSGVKGKGTTVLSTRRLSEARAKYNAMRISETDTITITVVAVIAQRHGTVTSKGESKNANSTND